MPRVEADEVVGINWEDFEQVKALAIKLGKEQLVIKYPGRKSFNITHSEREQEIMYEGYEIVWRT